MAFTRSAAVEVQPLRVAALAAVGASLALASFGIAPTTAAGQRPQAQTAGCRHGQVHRWGRCVPKAQIFKPNRRKLTGLPAARVLLPYLKNSTFTDCPRKWPRCPVENRYGHFASGAMYYCRLTPSPGSDIINGAAAYQIIGATVAKDGSWGVSLDVYSYGTHKYYSWFVGTTGRVRGIYWGPGSDPNADAPTSRLGGLLWVRGARSCAY